MTRFPPANKLDPLSMISARSRTLVESAGNIRTLKHNGFFKRFPHLARAYPWLPSRASIGSCARPQPRPRPVGDLAHPRCRRPCMCHRLEMRRFAGAGGIFSCAKKNMSRGCLPPHLTAAGNSVSPTRRASIQRSRTKIGDFDLEQQIMITLFCAFSSSLRYRSRWSGIPSTILVSQVPHPPIAHEKSTSTPSSSSVFKMVLPG
jgi:hypothetical protein